MAMMARTESRVENFATLALGAVLFLFSALALLVR
jgi:hypothetical protein